MTGIRIAIVGMGCRYPDANSPAQLWQTVLGRRTAFRLIPEQRLSSAYVGGRGDPDRTYVTHAGLLRDWEFDRTRFGVPGALFRAADLTHWLALQTAADTLADAGFPDADGLDRDQVGVLLGNTLCGEFTRAHQLRLRWPFMHRALGSALAESGVDTATAARVDAAMAELVRAPFPEPGDESLAGALANTIAGRVCNHFDFHGTGYTVDGACASSLLAVMTACRSLAIGELDFALAGGVDLSLDPFELVGFARLGALAVDEMRIYDAEPTGFLPGEGCGMVALMRAEDAERAGLRTYATIVGWGMSSDGAGGLTRPEAAGQVRALARAYRMSGVDPASVDLVEGHGTGTEVGDPTELRVLADIRGPGSRPAAIGSVKANLGHTKAAAGVAGLIKAALAVHHRVLPPTTGCRTPHPLLTGPDPAVRVLADAEVWPVAVPRASVSAMGFGGINTHLVLEGERARPARVCGAEVLAWSRPLPTHEIVLVGADSGNELAHRLDRLAERAALFSGAELHDLAATSARGATASVRCALVARTPGELATVAALARKRLADRPGALVIDDTGFALGSGSRARVGLLCPGQAAPVRSGLATWPSAVPVPDLPAGVVITDGDTDTAVAQPAILRQSLAGLAWLDLLGVRAVGAVGHSLGEITALVWAGALTPAAGLWLAAERGRLMAEHGRSNTAMAGLGVDVDSARRLVAGTDVTVAGVNSPTQTTVAGPRAQVIDLVRRAGDDGVLATLLPVSHGFHSAAMAPVADPLRAALSDVDFAEVGGTVFSTVTGDLLDPAADLVDLLVDQLTRPVRFLDAVTALAGRCDLLVEVGPGTTLTDLAMSGEVGIPGVAMDCAGVSHRHALATAALVAAGAADLKSWFGDRAHRELDLDRPISLLANPCEAPVGSVELKPTLEVTNGHPVAADQDTPLTVLREHLSRALELPLASIAPDVTLLNGLHLNSLQIVHTVAAVADLLGKRAPDAGRQLSSASVRDLAAVLADQPDAEPGGLAPVRGVRDWVRLFAHDWERCEPVRTDLDSLTVDLGAPSGPQETVRGLVAALLAVESAKPRRLLVRHHGHPAAAAFGRSLAVELDRCAVTVIDSAGPVDPAIVAESGYLELRVTEDGGYERAVTRPLVRGPATADGLAAGDVCLVTGGTSGITAHCAVALARTSGAKLVLLGRSPADAEETAAGLARIRERVPAHYLRCDVSDPDDVRAAVTAAALHGPVRGLLHGAALNAPRRIAEITAPSLLDAVRPKVIGLRTLLDAAPDLTLVVAFGSIIGRMGLAGQAEYCVANDWLRAEVETWARPGRRAHLIEWSVWSDLGMGERLNVLDSLGRQGVAAIRPDDGAAAMLAVLADASAPVTVLVSGRFPVGPTLAVTGPPASALRFAESTPMRTAGVETVLEASLSLGTDPYLDEHRVDGVPVLPAVVGLEAMAQAVTDVAGERAAWSFTDVVLDSPVTVDERAPRLVRIAALADDVGDGVDVVLRDDADGFTATRFATRVVAAPHPPKPVPVPPPPAIFDRHPFYGPLLFHTGRFQRLVGYDLLTAFEVRAWISARAHRWFSDFHSPHLLLGDPGAHDAALHALLACLPHRRALPVGADRMTVWRKPSGLLRVHAVERWHTADEYAYDVDVVDSDGRPVSSWAGLRLRAIGPRPWAGQVPASLIGPLLSRRLGELGIADRVELADGNPVRALTPGIRVVSATAGPPSALASVIAERTGEPIELAATRAWCAAQVLDRPEYGLSTEDGLVVLRSADGWAVTGRSGAGVVAVGGR